MRYADEWLADFIGEGLRSLDIQPTRQQIDQFAIFLEELKKWSKAINLTGIRKDRDIIVRHFFDSLLYLRVIPTNVQRIADIGSGAGFPGIPIKIVRPDIEMFLIEPATKKVIFLKHITKKLRMLGVTVVAKRIEDIDVAKDIGAPVDVVVTRALCEVREFVEKSAHILQPSGICIVSKGPKVHDELQRIGDLNYDVLALPLPFSTVVRYLVTVPVKKAASPDPA